MYLARLPIEAPTFFCKANDAYQRTKKWYAAVAVSDRQLSDNYKAAAGTSSHSLKRTSATTLLEEEHPDIVQHLGGWKSANSMKIYNDVRGRVRARAADRLIDLAAGGDAKRLCPSTPSDTGSSPPPAAAAGDGGTTSFGGPAPGAGLVGPAGGVATGAGPIDDGAGPVGGVVAGAGSAPAHRQLTQVPGGAVGGWVASGPPPPHPSHAARWDALALPAPGAPGWGTGGVPAAAGGVPAGGVPAASMSWDAQPWSGQYGMAMQSLVVHGAQPAHYNHGQPPQPPAASGPQHHLHSAPPPNSLMIRQQLLQQHQSFMAQQMHQQQMFQQQQMHMQMQHMYMAYPPH